MDELIHTTTGLQLGLDRSICWDLGGGSRSMEMDKAAIIFDTSKLSLLCSLTMVIPNRELVSIMNG